MDARAYDQIQLKVAYKQVHSTLNILNIKTQSAIGALTNILTYTCIYLHHPALAATLGQVLHSQFPVALRRETPTQYPCCVGSASE